MIWALLAMYFLGGGGASGSMLTSAGVKQLNEQTEIVVADPTRAEQAQLIIKDLGKEVKAFEKAFARSGRQLNKSYKDHAADVDQALAILDDLNSGWELSQQRALDLRFELRESLTEDEWTALFAGEQ